MDKQGAINKIKALKKFTIENATQGEVDNAILLISKLVAKYQIEEHEVNDTSSFVRFVTTEKYAKWSDFIVNAICKLTSTYSTIYNDLYCFYGLKQNVEIASELLTQLIACCQHYKAVEWRTGKFKELGRYEFNKGFCLGFAVNTSKLILDSMESEFKECSSDVSLAVISKQEEARKFAESMSKISHRQASMSFTVDRNSYDLGLKTAETKANITVNKKLK